ncbi:MAG: acyltransferase domain-containing protein [Chloroflexi bacterium]|nr:acyltransferase domain-containing protein [Chloroflexota bacterium]
MEIAIIGIGGRFPGAQTTEQFWQNLCEGVESISFFEDQEIEYSVFEPELASHPSHVKAAGVLQNVDQFDAAFFGYTPREAEIMDPQFRVFFEVAWEALERAGYDPDTAQAAIGVFAGAGSSSYLINNLLSNRDLLQESGGVFQTMLGNTSDQLTMMVSYKLNLKGPSVAVQTACSTSLVAVHLASQSLLIGDCDMALAGGVSIQFPQKSGYLYQEGGIMSPDGHCRAFDAGAQGTVNGYGAGVVVLKRLTNALSDGDHIYAVIKGSAINNDGSTKAGYTAPSIEGQARVISAAHTISEVDPATISYIETHGTGTPLGDPIEVAALNEVFRSTTDQRGFCAIGSVKTNVGHLDAAAGVTGLIKTALALHHQQIPPSLHFEAPNPKIDFANSPFYVNTKLTPWTANGAPRHAGVSSFGIGGTNAHVILEEAPPVAESSPGRSAQLLVLSAKTETALDTATQNLAAYLQQNPNANLADVAYTLQVGRKAFAQRRVLVARNAAEAVSILQSRDPKRTPTQTYNGGHRPIIFMFPGQGAQYVRMAADIYAEEPGFREEVDRCCELLRPHLGLDLRDVLYPHGDEATAAEQLNQTILTQPALFVIEYALARLLLSWGLKPHAMIGHSIGEYVAATLAGVIALEDALKIVAVRGQLIQNLPHGSMLVVPLPAAEVQGLLREENSQELALAASNGLSVSVVSGPDAAIAALREKLTQRGIECRIAHTSHAFHSAMMDPILAPFVEQVRRIKLSPPQMPYLSNLTGTWITAEQATDPEYWGKHLRQTVRFIEGIQELATISDAVFLEVGPGHTLSTLAKQSLSGEAEQRVIQTIRHLRSQVADEAFLLEAIGRLWLRGASIDWAAIHADQGRRRVPLPTYPFERQRYWVEAQQQTFTQQRSLNKKADLADWFYVPVWQQAPLPDRFEQDAPAAQRWLIFLDQAGLGERLAQRLSQNGVSVTTVAAGAEFAQLDAHAYSVNPQQPIDYQALFRELSTQHASPTLVVHLWSVTPDAQTHGDEQDQGFFSLLTLAQILGEQEDTAPIKLFVVSNNVQDVTGDEQIVPAKATILGASKVIPQEYATIACRSIDVGAIAQGRALDLAVEQLIAECSSDAEDDQVAYRSRHRWTRRFEAVPLQPNAQPAILRADGVYLITGGMSEFGLGLAEYLFQTAQAKLVLVDRSPLPMREQWPFWLETHDDRDKVSRVIRSVQALEAAGAEILLFSADVTNRERMAAVINEAQSRFGPINGVIHTDSVVGTGIIQLKTPELANSVFAPKLAGTQVLESLLAEHPLDLMVLFSSTTALTGGFGQADYCAANTFVDAYAHAHQGGDQPTRRVAINWGIWEWDDEQDQLMAGIPALQEQFRQLRLNYGMTLPEAIDAFARVLSRDLPQVIVSTQDFQAVMDQSSGLTAMNALEQLEKLRQVEPTHARPDLAVPYVAPRNEVEEIVTATLGRLLGMQQVGIEDNFFELGGNSLLAIQLVSALRAQFHVEIHMNSLFEAGTVADLAKIIEGAQEQQREREELEALLREIEQFSSAEAQERLIVEMGQGEETSNNG